MGPGSQLYFDGDPERFELFLLKFKAHLRLNKLLDVLSHTPSGREEEAAHQERNAVVFAELVQCLDDRAYPSLFGTFLMMVEKLWKFYVSII